MGRKSIHKAQSRLETFARQYVILNCDGKAAAIAAGYSKKTATFQASALLRKVKVKGLISSLLAAQTKKLDFSVERTLLEIARCAFIDPAKLFRPDKSIKSLEEMDVDTRACISAVEVGGRGGKRLDRVKLTDKLQALRMLAQYHKLFAEDRTPMDLGVKVIVLDMPRPARLAGSGAAALPPSNGHNGNGHNGNGSGPHEE
jgi:phage terminase small subunit